MALMRGAMSIFIPVHSLDSNGMKFPGNHNKNAKENWARKTFLSLCKYMPGIMHPRTTSVQICNEFFIFFFMFAFLLQTLLIFLQASLFASHGYQSLLSIFSRFFFLAMWLGHFGITLQQ